MNSTYQPQEQHRQRQQQQQQEQQQQQQQPDYRMTESYNEPNYNMTGSFVPMNQSAYVGGANQVNNSNYPEQRIDFGDKANFLK